MDKKDFKEILSKCFGKEKDSRYHAIAMLAIYGIFMLILVVVIRMSGSDLSYQDGTNSMTPTPTPVDTSIPNVDIDDNDADADVTDSNDINYSYSYTVTYNGVSEVYLGKKIDAKEKFTLIKDGVTTDYAILSDNYLKLENGIYHITENPSNFFKYCDVEKILLLTENEISIESNNSTKYNVSNADISRYFNDKISIDNEQTNLVQLNFIDDNLKNIDLDFSNYLSSVNGETVTLTIHMEFVDVGTTEDFEIKVS